VLVLPAHDILKEALNLGSAKNRGTIHIGEGAQSSGEVAPLGGGEFTSVVGSLRRLLRSRGADDGRVNLVVVSAVNFIGRIVSISVQSANPQTAVALSTEELAFATENTRKRSCEVSDCGAVGVTLFEVQI
jgi:hypothetical protein